jgi:hypothetical protein
MAHPFARAARHPSMAQLASAIHICVGSFHSIKIQQKREKHEILIHLNRFLFNWSCWSCWRRCMRKLHPHFIAKQRFRIVHTNFRFSFAFEINEALCFLERSLRLHCALVASAWLERHFDFDLLACIVFPRHSRACGKAEQSRRMSAVSNAPRFLLHLAFALLEPSALR